MKTFSTPSITLESAKTVADLALKYARKTDVKASIAIVDASMNLITFLKDDQATPHSTFTSMKKAQTAASTKRATGWMSEDIAITLPLGSDNALTNIPGGIPIYHGVDVVGALGIAGGTVEQDEQIAKQTLDSFQG